MVARHGIRSANLLRWRVFYLPMVELEHIPGSHMLKEYEGIICILSSYLTRDTSQTILTRYQTLFSQNILIKEFMKKFHIWFVTQSHSPYQRSPLRLPYNGQQNSLLIFQRIISCCSSQSIPKSTIHGFQLQGYLNLLSKRFHIMAFFYIVQCLTYKTKVH